MMVTFATSLKMPLTKQAAATLQPVLAPLGAKRTTFLRVANWKVPLEIPPALATVTTPLITMLKVWA